MDTTCLVKGQKQTTTLNYEISISNTSFSEVTGSKGTVDTLSKIVKMVQQFKLTDHDK
jgi:hypothetical protein